MDVEIRQMKESELSQVARLVQRVFGYDAVSTEGWIRAIFQLLLSSVEIL